MPLPATEATVTLEAPAAGPTASFAPGGHVGGSGFDEELRLLLRYRLILINLLAMIGGLLFVVTAILALMGCGCAADWSAEQAAQ
jgi:hypothetical protein